MDASWSPERSMKSPNVQGNLPSAGVYSTDVSPLLRQTQSDYELEELRPGTTPGPNDETEVLSTATTEPGQSNAPSIRTSAVTCSSTKWPGCNVATLWIPISLRRFYLHALTVLSMSLAVCCFALVAVSSSNNGIADAGASGGFNFRKRFLPTFVAVVYTLFWAPVAADVIRTEPWALLSKTVGSKAQDSLLKKDQLWWSHIADAVRARTRSDGVRWALLISVVASLISSIVINPLSAGLFDTLRFMSTEDERFFGAQLSSSNSQPARIGDATYLRAAINILFKVPTSVWNTDQYSVAPFWPSTVAEPPLSANFARSSSSWVADQDVLTAKLRCQPFTSVTNSTEPYGSTVWRNLPYLQTDDGCAVIPTPKANGWCGGAIWDQITNTSSQKTFEKCISQGFREYFAFCSVNANSSGMLHQTYSNQKTYLSGQVCSTSYIRAKVPVSVSNTRLESVVSVDDTIFANGQQPLDESNFDIAAFEREFIIQTGSTHLRPTLGIGFDLANTDMNSNFEGPALVLAADHNYNVDSLMQAKQEELSRRAATIKQRFLGEVLLAGFSEAISEGTTRTLQGSVTEEKYRLIVDLGVGITMGLVFILLALAAAALSYMVALERRPLCLPSDPNNSSTAALILKDTTTSDQFADLDRATAKELDSSLSDETFGMENFKLVYISRETVMPKALVPLKSQGSGRPWYGRRKKASATTVPVTWRPFTLQRKAGILLVVSLSCVVSALVAVYDLSRREPLYQAAFVYSSNFNIGNLQVTRLAPYSIIPTLIAVGIKLWWGTIDSAHRRLAPFLALAGSSKSRTSKSPSKSYLTTPILWVTYIALRRRHWLLAIVTLGALISEVLQISMAALWSRELGILNFDVVLTKKYEIRSFPHVFSDTQPEIRGGRNIAYPKIVQHLYGGELYQTSWVYGSLAELAFSAAPPAWSKEGWSFPPVDLTDVLNRVPKLPRSESIGVSGSVNVTLPSQGLRARIECMAIHEDSRWISEVTNLTALTPYNSSLHETRSRIRSGFEFTPEVRVVNFSDFTNSRPGTVAIGQWLHFNYSSVSDRGDPLYTSTNPQNFTVLWTNSSYPYLYEDNLSDAPTNIFDVPPRLIFAERPQVQALNCRPMFETSRAQITVNSNSGKIEDMDLVGHVDPVPNAWASRFERHFSNETDYYYQQPSSSLDGVRAFNTTVSWGYLFQLAVLQACNVQGFVTGTGDYLGSGVPGPTPFSFIEPDLYSDPYSYASLALVNYTRTSLLDSTTLTDVTQRVFSTFFQWFVSTQSGYTDDYWAYQPIGAALPSDLDFGSTESTVISIETFTREATFCASSASTYIASYEDGPRTFTNQYCARPTSTSYSTWTKTETFVTIADTRPPLSRTTISNATPTVARISSHTTTTSTARLHKRALDPTNVRAGDNTIQATASVHTETLVISPVALFLSVAIIALLIVFTIIIYFVQNHQLRLLPRDFDSPASLLSAVHASEKLKSWAEQQHKRQTLSKKKSLWRRMRGDRSDEAVAAKLGYFIGTDGKEHWGVEITEDHAPLMTHLPREDEEAPPQEQTPPAHHTSWQDRTAVHDAAPPHLAITPDRVISQDAPTPRDRTPSQAQSPAHNRALRQERAITPETLCSDSRVTNMRTS